MAKLSPGALRAVADQAIRAAIDACPELAAADPEGRARWLVHPIDTAFDSIDWQGIKKGQHAELCAMVRAGLAHLRPIDFLALPAPSAVPLRLIGPRGGPIARSHFYRGPNYWQWVGFDRFGQVQHVCESEFRTMAECRAALWELRGIAARSINVGA